MTTTLVRLRPFLIGLIALLFTAGIAFAGRPSTPANGPSVASEAAGKTVPVSTEQRSSGQGAETDEDAAEAANEVPDEDSNADTEVDATDSDQDAADNCATDPSGLTPEQLADVRHGSVVCWAAQQETPAGYDNHGQWVSEWARKNNGQTPSAANSSETAGAQAADRPGNGKSRKP